MTLGAISNDKMDIANHSESSIAETTTKYCKYSNKINYDSSASNFLVSNIVLVHFFSSFFL